MSAETFFNKIKGGLIISCYASSDYNQFYNNKGAIIALIKSVEAGGAAGIRINLDWIATAKEVLRLPVIGIKKIYREGQLRITPTINEVRSIVASGADAVAIDATKQNRFDKKSLSEFIREIRQESNIIILGDISSVEEGIQAEEFGMDGISTTLAGYTINSSSVGGKLGDIPPKSPDYEVIENLSRKVHFPIIAEGRFNTPEKAKKAINAGAHSVVVGTAISNTQKITESFGFALKTI